MRLIDHTGQRFGRLLVVERVFPNHGTRVRWRCQCDCGNEITVDAGHLHAGHTQSCGCYRKEVTTARATTHGHGGRGNQHQLYHTWQNIIKRCENPDTPCFHNYGGRGVTMHVPWRDDFARFLADILTELGERPPRCSLDRINNDGNYEPGNLRWATAKVQANNRRTARPDLDVAEIVDLYEQGLTTRAIGTRLGCSRNTIEDRLREAGVALRVGAPPRLPLDVSQMRALRSQGLSYEAIADRMGCGTMTVWKRLRA